MRQVVLDTETTGLKAAEGHRIIEIGCVEIINRQLTPNHFHEYINPERDSDADALRVHGITTEFLNDKPLFAQIVDRFLDYVRGAELIIHNAAFDIGFIDYELSLLGRAPLQEYVAGVVDSLDLARQQYPGKRNSLDALCDRLDINRTARTLHGALLDAQLLAEVYIRLTRGQDSLLGLDADLDGYPAPVADAAASARMARTIATQALHLPVIHASPAEREAHEAMLAVLDKASGGKTVWRRMQDGGAPGSASS